jgi:hypothetical protein
VAEAARLVRSVVMVTIVPVVGLKHRRAPKVGLASDRLVA